MPEAVGPVLQLGRGASLGVEWRYSLYESTMGLCTRVEMQGAMGTSESCGVTIGDEAAGPISVMSVGTGTGVPSQVEGYATDVVREVWIDTDAGPVPATVMSLEPASMDGQLFFALVPGDRHIRDAVAVDASGEEIGRATVDAP